MMQTLNRAWEFNKTFRHSLKVCSCAAMRSLRKMRRWEVDVDYPQGNVEWGGLALRQRGGHTARSD